MSEYFPQDEDDARREENSGWDTSETTGEEEEYIVDLSGVAEHNSHDVIVDPETDERWALCWVRMPRPTKEGE